MLSGPGFGAPQPFFFLGSGGGGSNSEGGGGGRSLEGGGGGANELGGGGGTNESGGGGGGDGGLPSLSLGGGGTASALFEYPFEAMTRNMRGRIDVSKLDNIYSLTNFRRLKPAKELAQDKITLKTEYQRQG